MDGIVVQMLPLILGAILAPVWIIIVLLARACALFLTFRQS